MKILPVAIAAAGLAALAGEGPAIAVDPVRSFAGVVLGNRLASKQKTMGTRLHLLDLMA